MDYGRIYIKQVTSSASGNMLSCTCRGWGILCWPHYSRTGALQIYDDDDDEGRMLFLAHDRGRTKLIRRSAYYAPPHRAEALSDDARLTSVCRVHRA